MCHSLDCVPDLTSPILAENSKTAFWLDYLPILESHTNTTRTFTNKLKTVSTRLTSNPLHEFSKLAVEQCYPQGLSPDWPLLREPFQQCLPDNVATPLPSPSCHKLCTKGVKAGQEGELADRHLVSSYGKGKYATGKQTETKMSSLEPTLVGWRLPAY